MILTMFVLSCKKTDPTPSGPNRDLLAKTWKLTSSTINGNDLFSTLSSCTTDDLFIYTKDGKYTHDEGTTKCDTSDPQIVETASWSLQQNLLTYTYPDQSVETYLIHQRTATTLKFTFTVSAGGNNISAVSTYTVQ
ncbi:MAG TPA: lipocalin family protein [Cyclobacteriaceae bacterium]|nr:lipocalin family protein [Cyclobacteriaceae bacterium]